VLLLPASALAAELFRSGSAAAWLYGSALHGDVPLRAAGSAISGAYLNILGHGVGWPSPEGGAGRLATALEGYYASLGGRSRVSTPVASIQSAQGRVRGVVTAEGEVLTAPVVIADVMPQELLRLAGDALPGAYRARMARYRYGPETVKVDWALDGPIPWTAAEPRLAGTVHVGGEAGEIERGILQTELGELPERPFLLLGQQSLADPSRAPAGKHTAWAYTHAPRGYGWSQGALERHVERIEAQIERFAPGFRGRVLARHVLSPANFERENANLVGGDVGGGSYALDQLVFRPIPSLAPYRTPITGLYIGSAATFPGGAVHGAGGYAAARLALAEGWVRRYWAGARRPALQRRLAGQEGLQAVEQGGERGEGGLDGCGGGEVHAGGAQGVERGD
jgi:phytoene dehydrogenase-like protein